MLYVLFSLNFCQGHTQRTLNIDMPFRREMAMNDLNNVTALVMLL